MQDISYEFHLSDDELFVKVGESIYSRTLQVRKVTTKELVESGRRWFLLKTEEFSSVFCGNSYIRQLVGDKSSGAELITVMIDALEQSHIKIFPVPASTCALLFLRVGYGKLCGDGRVKKE